MIRFDWPNVLLGTALSFPLGFAVSWLWERYRRFEDWRSNAIEIHSPRPGETLNERDARIVEGMRCFAVRGKLGFVPEGHAIWILLQTPGGTSTWPQGFYKVNFDNESHTWHGFFFAPDRGRQVQVAAVVAPPTSQEFFTYYQSQVSATKAAPLSGIPPKCKNVATVVATVP
jgi:hypothetical protein